MNWIFIINNLINFTDILFGLKIIWKTSICGSSSTKYVNPIMTTHLYRESTNEVPYNQPVITPFNPEFTIVIFTHYKPRIAVAILDL